MKGKRGASMEWDYKEELKGIAKASIESWEMLRDGVCVVCGSTEAGYYDLCQDCYDKPIPDYEASHVARMFSILHSAVLSDMAKQLSSAYDEGKAAEATAAYKDYCFSFGTPGRLYYNEQKSKADRTEDPTPGSLRHLLKVYG